MYALYFIIILCFSSNVSAMEQKDHNLCKSVEKNAIDKKLGQHITWHGELYTVTQRQEDADHVHMVIARPKHALIGIPLVIEYVARQFNKSDKLSNHGIVTHVFTKEGKNILFATTAVSSIIALYLCLQ